MSNVNRADTWSMELESFQMFIQIVNVTDRDLGFARKDLHQFGHGDFVKIHFQLDPR